MPYKSIFYHIVKTSNEINWAIGGNKHYLSHSNKTSKMESYVLSLQGGATLLLTCYLEVDRFFWLKVPAMCQSHMSVYVPGHQLFQVFAICWNLNLPPVDLQVVSNHKTSYSTA